MKIQQHQPKGLAALISLFEGIESLRAVIGYSRLHIPAAAYFCEYATVCGVIIDDKHRQATQVSHIRCRVLDSGQLAQTEASCKVKRAAMSHLAFDPYAAPHHINQLAGDRQP